MTMIPMCDVCGSVIEDGEKAVEIKYGQFRGTKILPWRKWSFINPFSGVERTAVIHKRCVNEGLREDSNLTAGEFLRRITHHISD